MQYVYVRLLRCRYLWRTERSPKKAFSIVDGAKQLYNLTGLPRCHGEHRRWKMRRIEACSIKSHSASSPWLDLSTTKQVSESVSLQCIAFSQHHLTASQWHCIVLEEGAAKLCAAAGYICAVCSVQCSRTRLTGLGHFHFLAQQQVHLNTAADDGDDYNHGNKMAKIICEYCS